MVENRDGSGPVEFGAAAPTAGVQGNGRPAGPAPRTWTEVVLSPRQAAGGPAFSGICRELASGPPTGEVTTASLEEKSVRPTSPGTNFQLVPHGVVQDRATAGQARWGYYGDWPGRDGGQQQGRAGRQAGRIAMNGREAG